MLKVIEQDLKAKNEVLSLKLIANKECALRSEVDFNQI